MRRALQPSAGRVKSARPRAVLYARVSTPGQAEDDRWSLPRQRADFARYCTEHGYEPAGEYQDVMSGTRNDRPGYLRMVADAKDGKFERVVASNTSRFGRDQEEAVYRFLWLKKECGVGVEFIHESHRDLADFVDDADYSQKFIRKLTTDVRNAMEERALTGKILGRAAYGYRIEDGQLVVHEPEAAVVRRVFDLYTTEMLGMGAIAARLNREGFRAPQGGEFHPRAIGSILERATYRGLYSWGGVEIEGHHEAIVSPEQWHLAQRIRRRKSDLNAPRSHLSPFLLAGLLRCGYCGGPMVGTAAASKPRRYYRCKYRYGQKSCPYPEGAPASIEAGEIEEAVVEALSARLGTVDAVEADTAGELAAARAAVAQAQADVEATERRFAQNLSLYYDQRISVEEFERANAIVRQQEDEATRRKDASLDRLQAAVHAADRAENDAGRVQSFADLWRGGSVIQAKSILHAIVEKIVVTGEEVHIERRLFQ